MHLIFLDVTCSTCITVLVLPFQGWTLVTTNWCAHLQGLPPLLCLALLNCFQLKPPDFCPSTLTYPLVSSLLSSILVIMLVRLHEIIFWSHRKLSNCLVSTIFLHTLSQCTMSLWYGRFFYMALFGLGYLLYFLYNIFITVTFLHQAWEVNNMLQNK